MSPKNTGHGSSREREGPSIGVFIEERRQGGDFDRTLGRVTESIKPEVCECGYERDSFACRIRHQHLDLQWARDSH